MFYHPFTQFTQFSRQFKFLPIYFPARQIPTNSDSCQAFFAKQNPAWHITTNQFSRILNWRENKLTGFCYARIFLAEIAFQDFEVAGIFGAGIWIGGNSKRRVNWDTPILGRHAAQERCWQQQPSWAPMFRSTVAQQPQLFACWSVRLSIHIEDAL